MLILTFGSGLHIFLHDKVQLSSHPLTEKGELFKVIVYNRHVSLTEHSVVAEWLKMENPDVFVILEAGSSHAAFASKDLKNSYPFQLLYPRKDAFGMIFLSKFPIISTQQIFDNSRDFTNFRLVANILFSNGHDVSFVALHTTPPVSHLFHETRNQELLQTADIIENLSHSSQRIIFLGDWNITPYSAYFIDIQRRTNMVNKYSSLLPVSTWPAYLPDMLQIPIDHVLYKGHITLLEKRKGPAMGSDHHPVIATFQIEE